MKASIFHDGLNSKIQILLNRGWSSSMMSRVPFLDVLRGRICNSYFPQANNKSITQELGWRADVQFPELSNLKRPEPCTVPTCL